MDGMKLDPKGPFGKNREAWVDYAVATVWSEDETRPTNLYKSVCKLCGKWVFPGDAVGYNLRKFCNRYRNKHFLCMGCHVWVLAHMMRWRKFMEGRKSIPKRERKENSHG